MSLQVASLFGVLRMDDSQFKSSVKDAKSGLGDLTDRMKNVGGQMQSFGSKLTLATAPLAAGLGAGVVLATNFDTAMTNIQAVTGSSNEEMKGLSAELLKMGGNTVHGPQAVAEAMYDIAGGVQGADLQMQILRASMDTAVAGNADLAGTTKALISVMNSYKFTARQAGFASDVLTRTVGMGVGSMDEFASALPQVTGLANTLGISFDDLGAMTAYLTTQGNTASQSTTQLAAMMTALLNPNETMKNGLKELGFASGQAAIDQLGLVGAFQALAGTQTATTDGMAKMSGSVEALRGITSLTGSDVAAFFETFKSGVNSATDMAASIQLQGPAAQFDLLKSKVSELGITVGNALLPTLLDLANDLTPVVNSVVDWMGKNPELTNQIVLLTGGLILLGPAIGLAGWVLSGLATIIGTVGTAIGGLLLFAMTPLGVALLVGAGLVAAYVTNFGGFKDWVDNTVAPAIRKIIGLIGDIIKQWQGAIDIMTEYMRVKNLALEVEASRSAVAGVAANPATAVTNTYGLFGGYAGMPDSARAHQQYMDSHPGATTGLDALLNTLTKSQKDHEIGLQNQMAEYIRSQMLLNVSTGTYEMKGTNKHYQWNPETQTYDYKDSGGMGTAGMPYMIGTGAQPELFVPSSAGSFYPNADRMGGQGITITGPVTVIANNPQDFMQKLQAEARRVGA